MARDQVGERPFKTDEFMAYVRELQATHGLSQRGVAALLGISPSTLSRIKCGRRSVGLMLYSHLIRVAGRQPGDWLDGW